MGNQVAVVVLFTFASLVSDSIGFDFLQDLYILKNTVHMIQTDWLSVQKLREKAGNKVNVVMENEGAHSFFKC